MNIIHLHQILLRASSWGGLGKPGFILKAEGGSSRSLGLALLSIFFPVWWEEAHNARLPHLSMSGDGCTAMLCGHAAQENPQGVSLLTFWSTLSCKVLRCAHPHLDVQSRRPQVLIPGWASHGAFRYVCFHGWPDMGRLCRLS